MDDSFERFSLFISNLSIAILLNFTFEVILGFFLRILPLLAFFFLGRLLCQIFF